MYKNVRSNQYEHLYLRSRRRGQASLPAGPLLALSSHPCDLCMRAPSPVRASSLARLRSRLEHAALIPVDPRAEIVDLALLDKVAELELRLVGAPHALVGI